MEEGNHTGPIMDVALLTEGLIGAIVGDITKVIS
jgi:hypothetical protein